MKFHANNVEYWSENQVETVFFGNAEKELALLLSNIPNTTDHYFEWNDQANACVNAVKKMQLSDQTLKIELLPEAAKQIGHKAFTVDFSCSEAVLKGISQQLSLIFKDKLFVKSTNKAKKEASKQDYSKVKYLNLEGKNLCELPDYVSEMTVLETVKLARNPQLDFHAVCEVLGKLPTVKHLAVSAEQGVPENIGKLIHLETLSILDVKMHQTLPESIGTLKKLKYFCMMGDADIILPESFADLIELEDLVIRLPHWQLPSKFYQLSKLKQLDFTNCRLVQFPAEIVLMDKVETVIFGEHETYNFSQIMSLIAQMPHVRVLEIDINPIPKEVGLCKQIIELNIWTGVNKEKPLHLPDELFELTQLKILNLSFNYFDKIPDAIENLKALKMLIIQGADFESLPDSVGNLSNLEHLDISENPSLRFLPESLGKLTQLKQLNLSENPLLSRLPNSVVNLTNLEVVNILDRKKFENIPETWNDLFI